MLCLIILTSKHDLQKKNIQKKKHKEAPQNIYESRIKSIFNFIFFTFQMNIIFNYLKKELIIQHACVVQL